MRKSEGITLVTLVITIIVMIILAGTTVFTGKYLINSSQVTKFTADMKVIQGHVNSFYEEIKLGDTSYYQTGRNIETLTAQTKTQVNIALAAEGILESDKVNFRYFNESDLNTIGIEGIDREVLINFYTRQVLSVYPVEKDGNLYYSQQALDGTNYNVAYDATTNTGQLDFELTNEKNDYNWKIDLINIKFPGHVNSGRVLYKEQQETIWKTVTGYSFIVDQPGVYSVKLIDAEGNEKVKDEYIYKNDGLILWYDTLNNTGKGYSATTTKWKDLSGNDNDGILSGFNNNSSSGWQSNCLKFDGTNDYVRTTANLNFANSKQMTFSFVDLNGAMYTNTSGVLFETSSNSNNYSGAFYINTDEYGTNDIQLAMKYGSLKNHKLVNNILKENISAVYTIVLDTTKPHDTFISIYKNGVLQTLTNQNNGNISNNTLTNYILYIASRAGSLAFTKMDLASLRIYNRALNASEIQTLSKIENTKYITGTPQYVTTGLVLHYDGINNTGYGHSETAGTWKDLSGNGNDGVLNNFAYTSTSGWKNKSLLFNGTNNFVLTTNNVINNKEQYTLCFTVKRTAIPNSGLYCNRSVMGKGTSIFMLDDGFLRFDRGDNQWSTAQNIIINQTTDIVCVGGSEGRSLYINGVKVANTNNKGTIQDEYDLITTFGASQVSGSSYGNYFAGEMNSVRVYNRALTDKEIKQNYEIGKTRFGI